MLRNLFLGLLMAGLPQIAVAQDAITYPFDGSFEDASFAIENAIIDRGLVIDYKGRCQWHRSLWSRGTCVWVQRR